MRTTTLFLPLAASLMLGTAAFAQDQMQGTPQPAATPDQNSATTANAPQMSEQGQDPRQSAAGGMPVDQATNINGIEAACTGVSDGTESAAQWKNYPVKIVVSGDRHQYFAGEHVTVTKSDGTQVADAVCNAPWVLMKLQPGAYKATVELPGHNTKSVAFTAPSRGQREVNVVYRGAEASDNRATSTSYQQPSSQPMPQQAPSNTQPTMDQSPNNSDQSPQK